MCALCMCIALCAGGEGHCLLSEGCPSHLLPITNSPARVPVATIAQVEKDNAFEVKADLPGVKKEDIKVTGAAFESAVCL